MPERRDHGLLEGDRTAGGSVGQWLRGDYFPPALSGLCIAKQNSRPTAILRWRYGPPRCSGCRPVPPAV
jgi:hypothetical protein